MSSIPSPFTKPHPPRPRWRPALDTRLSSLERGRPYETADTRSELRNCTFCTFCTSTSLNTRCQSSPIKLNQALQKKSAGTRLRLTPSLKPLNSLLLNFVPMLDQQPKHRFVVLRAEGWT